MSKMLLLRWFFSLPTIKKPVCINDKYDNGVVKNIEFKCGEFIIVWVTYKTKTKAYRT